MSTPEGAWMKSGADEWIVGVTVKQCGLLRNGYLHLWRQTQQGSPQLVTMNTVLVTVCLVEPRPIHKLHAVSRAPSPTGWILLSKPYQQQPFMVGGMESRESRMAPYASAAIRSIATCWSQSHPGCWPGIRSAGGGSCSGRGRSMPRWSAQPAWLPMEREPMPKPQEDIALDLGLGSTGPLARMPSRCCRLAPVRWS